MEERPLGGSGVAVSRLILGCGNFGGIGSAPALFGQGTQRDEAFRLMDAAWELGITTFDTADAYGGGRSETLHRRMAADEGDQASATGIVIQTKTFNPMDSGHDHGLARTRIRRQIETSLDRLGVERVALYMAHAFDPDVPQEETLLAFDELVRAGKVGAVGASNFTGEELAEALELASLEGPAALRVGAELLLAPRAGRPRDGLPALPRARPRLRAVRPARRRLADGQVPPRRAAARRLAHDAASRG